MFRQIIISALLILSSAYLSDNQELRRQYNSYLRIFKKSETPSGFETFAQNLNTIEVYNKQNNGCKMYLTQHSDTFENRYIYNTCDKTDRNNLK
jgi:hypothetical protein